jgi:hypothetical protein
LEKSLFSLSPWVRPSLLLEGEANPIDESCIKTARLSQKDICVQEQTKVDTKRGGALVSRVEMVVKDGGETVESRLLSGYDTSAYVTFASINPYASSCKFS